MIENALREMLRILKPEGKLLIIDKNEKKLGGRKLPAWEQWFRGAKLIKMLKKLGAVGEYEFISYAHRTTPDGLFIAWKIRKLYLDHE